MKMVKEKSKELARISIMCIVVLVAIAPVIISFLWEGVLMGWRKGEDLFAEFNEWVEEHED